MPCDTMVLSRATTAPPEASASATDGWSTTAPAATEAPPSHGIVSHVFRDEASDGDGARWPARAATRRDARTSISPRETRGRGGGLSAPRVGVGLERARVLRFSARSAFFLSTTFSILLRLRRRLFRVVVVQRLLRLLLLLRVARAEGRRGWVRRGAPSSSSANTNVMSSPVSRYDATAATAMATDHRLRRRNRISFAERGFFFVRVGSSASAPEPPPPGLLVPGYPHQPRRLPPPGAPGGSSHFELSMASMAHPPAPPAPASSGNVARRTRST